MILEKKSLDKRFFKVKLVDSNSEAYVYELNRCAEVVRPTAKIQSTFSILSKLIYNISCGVLPVILI